MKVTQWIVLLLLFALIAVVGTQGITSQHLSYDGFAHMCDLYIWQGEYACFLKSTLRFNPFMR